MYFYEESITDYIPIIEGDIKNALGIILNTNILIWFKEHSSSYDNIRILKTKLENAIFYKNKRAEISNYYIYV